MFIRLVVVLLCSVTINHAMVKQNIAGLNSIAHQSEFTLTRSKDTKHFVTSTSPFSYRTSVIIITTLINNTTKAALSVETLIDSNGSADKTLFTPGYTREWRELYVRLHKAAQKYQDHIGGPLLNPDITKIDNEPLTVNFGSTDVPVSDQCCYINCCSIQ